MKSEIVNYFDDPGPERGFRDGESRGFVDKFYILVQTVDEMR